MGIKYKWAKDSNEPMLGKRQVKKEQNRKDRE